MPLEEDYTPSLQEVRFCFTESSHVRISANHMSEQDTAMTSPAEHYRSLAAAAREQAGAASLPQVKLRYLRSAEHFDELSGSLENVAQCKLRNEAARAGTVI